MGSLAIRNIADDLKRALRLRGALRGALMDDGLARNVRDVADCGVEIVNPWEPADR